MSSLWYGIRMNANIKHIERNVVQTSSVTGKKTIVKSGFPEISLDLVLQASQKQFHSQSEKLAERFKEAELKPSLIIIF